MTAPTPVILLLVDDDDSFALIIKEALNLQVGLREGYSLHWVNDGDLALQYVRGEGPYADRTKSPMPDIILLDHRMPRMDGRDVLVELKKDPATSSIPTCLLSTSSQQSLLRDCYQLGATICMEKPMDMDELTRKLEVFLRFWQEVAVLPSSDD